MHIKITIKPEMLCVLLLILTVFSSTVSAGIKLDVTVEGVEGELKENVLAYLTIDRQKDHPDLTPSLARKLHRQAPDEIREALQPFGYYNPVISAELTDTEPRWHATYKIETGEPVHIETMDVAIAGAGADDEVFAALKEQLPLKQGDILNHQRYEEAKRMLYDRAVRSGYLKAEMMSANVNVYPDKNSAAVTLHLETGPKYYFGDVGFVQDAFDSGFLSRFVPFKSGEPYSLSGVLALQNSLTDSDYFDSVEIDPLISEAEDRRVPVEVTLIPRKRNQYTVGLGYGTDTGIRGSLGWENRRITRTGHRMKTVLRLSEVRSGLTTEYTVPLANPRTDNVTFTAGWLTEDTTTSQSDKVFSGVRYNHMRGRWKESVYINYEDEQFEVGEDTGRSTLLIPGISWTRIMAGSPVTADQGSRIFLDIRGAQEALISDTSFLQVRTQIKHIRTVMPGGRLILRAEAGASTVDDFSKLPPSVRFFAGGDNSVRGYAYNSLGPEDDEGNVIGGRHLLAGSIEYEHQIRDKWSAAVFFDTGNALDSLSDRLKNGTGFGVRWQSPVGPVRLDLAFPLDESEKSWRIHFSVGPDL